MCSILNAINQKKNITIIISFRTILVFNSTDNKPHKSNILKYQGIK